MKKKRKLFIRPSISDVLFRCEESPKSIQIFKEIHVDGGAFVSPPTYKFHDAYFSVLSNENELIHFEKNIGDVWSGVAEYEAIKWAVENITERPLKIYSDCTVAISWARKGANTKKFHLPKLHLQGIEIEYKHDNFADRWNAANHSPKKDKKFYIERYYASKSK